jgi:hypothetical protein
MEIVGCFEIWGLLPKNRNQHNQQWEGNEAPSDELYNGLRFWIVIGLYLWSDPFHQGGGTSHREDTEQLKDAQNNPQTITIHAAASEAFLSNSATISSMLQT